MLVHGSTVFLMGFDVPNATVTHGAETGSKTGIRTYDLLAESTSFIPAIWNSDNPIK